MNLTPLACKTSTQKRGFTLIELMVVITIIGTLAALIFPTIRTMKSKAELTKCTSQLRQWAVAIQGYAGDHNQMVRYNEWSDIGGGTNPAKRYYNPYLGGEIQTWPPSSRAGAPKQGIPLGYFRMCPAQKWDTTANPPEGYIFVRPNELNSSGGYSRGELDTDADTFPDSYNIGKVARPSQLLMMMDATLPKTIYRTSEYTTYVKPVCINADKTKIRHGGGVNGLFADGHVEFLKWEQINPDIPENAQKGTTWLNLN